MNPPRPRVSGFSRVGFAALLVTAITLALCWHHLRRPAPSPVDPSASIGLSASLSPELTRIFAEPDELLREHLLADWVAVHTLEQIIEQLRGLPEAQRLPIANLASLKLRDLITNAPNDFKKYHLLDQHPALYRDNVAALTPITLADSLMNQASLDPLGTLRKIAAMRLSADDRNEVQLYILHVISKKDPPKALALLNSMSGIKRRLARDTIIENWTELDPAGALAWARQQPQSTRSINAVLGMWSRTDPSSALEAASTLPPDQASLAGMPSVLKTWMEESPAESIAWLKKLPHPDPDLISAAIDVLGKSNPQVVQALLSHPLSAPLRNQLTERLASTWAESDPVAAARWVQTLPKDKAYLNALNSVISPLAHKDLPAALALYRSLPEGTNARTIISTITAQLPSQEALTWILNQPSSATTDTALEAIFNRPEFSSFAQIQTTLLQIPPGPALDLAYEKATRLKFSENPSGITDWLRSLPTGPTRDHALQAISSDWTRTALVDAKAYYAQELSAGIVSDTLAAAIKSRIAEKDPVAAVDWILAQPSTPAMRGQVEFAFRDLAEKQSAVAIEKIRALPVGESRSAALGGLISDLSYTQPDQAARLLFSIGTPAEQLAHIDAVAQRMIYNAPSEATPWLQTLPAGPIRDAALSASASTLANNDPSAPLSLLPLATTDETRFTLARTALLALQFKDEQSARAALARLTLPPEILARLKETLDDHAER